MKTSDCKERGRHISRAKDNGLASSAKSGTGREV